MPAKSNLKPSKAVVKPKRPKSPKPKTSPRSKSPKPKTSPRSKSPKQKTTSLSKKALKNTEDQEDIVDDEDIDEMDGETAETEQFFDPSQFVNFDKKIKFHVFDPNKYQNELHKEVMIVANNQRRTSDVITKFEFTEVTSNRAKQIENGGDIFTDVGNESDPIKMATMEIKMKCCPLSIKRYISGNIAEIWEVNELLIPYINN